MRQLIRQYATVQTVTQIGAFPLNSTIYLLIQPTGRIHLGNYLGAVRNWKDLAQESSSQDIPSNCIFGTADLHAITVFKEPTELKKFRYETLASLLSAGLDPTKCILYHQLSVPEHSQLSWIFTCLTNIGSLNRMTQWKLKAHLNDSGSLFDEEVGKAKAGLLCYPVLQAADVLLYKATHVPVGDDQSQHLELTRGIATTFNHSYKTNMFPLPKTLLTPTKKILSLRNPDKKMSKSDPDQNSCIYVNEEPEAIAKKIRKATTDSIQGGIYYDPDGRPGVSNLINIVSGITRKSIDDTVKDMEWMTNHKQLKDYVTEVIVEELKPRRHLFDELMTDKAYLEQIANEGSRKAREIATTNMDQINKLIGFD